MLRAWLVQIRDKAQTLLLGPLVNFKGAKMRPVCKITHPAKHSVNDKKSKIIRRIHISEIG